MNFGFIFRICVFALQHVVRVIFLKKVDATSEIANLVILGGYFLLLITVDLDSKLDRGPGKKAVQVRERWQKLKKEGYFRTCRVKVLRFYERCNTLKPFFLLPVSSLWSLWAPNGIASSSEANSHQKLTASTKANSPNMDPRPTWTRDPRQHREYSAGTHRQTRTLKPEPAPA